LPLGVGPSIAALGFLIFIQLGIGGSYWATFFPAVVVLGLGMALSVAPLTTTVMNAVANNRVGIASGVNNAVSRVGGLLGIALLGIVIVHAFNRELDHRLVRPDIPPEVRLSIDEQRVRLAGARLPASMDDETRVALRQAINESFVGGFRMVMMMAVGLALASALCAWLMIADSPGDSPAMGNLLQTE
jgi:ABC-type multidrug transport system fused ATPase/permease subunit